MPDTTIIKYKWWLASKQRRRRRRRRNRGTKAGIFRTSTLACHSSWIRRWVQQK